MVEKIDIEQLFADCKESLPIKKQDFEINAQSIEKDIEDYSSHLETSVENWIDTNLTYIYDNIKCMYIFPDSEISKIVVESLMKRQQYLKKKFQDIQSHSFKIKNELTAPIKIQPIIYMRDNLFPMIAEIIILRDQILSITKKYYKF